MQSLRRVAQWLSGIHPKMEQVSLRIYNAERCFMSLSYQMTSLSVEFVSCLLRLQTPRPQIIQNLQKTSKQLSQASFAIIRKASLQHRSH